MENQHLGADSLMKIERSMNVYQVNAFADHVAPGSPTGVVLDSDRLDAVEMLQIARRLKYSHTAFLSASRHEHCLFAIRFFTPEGELKNCAHATIAAHALWSSEFGFEPGRRTQQETSTGVQNVWVTESDEGLVVSFKQNEIVQKGVDHPTARRLTDALGCGPAALHETYPVQLASPGSFRFLVPLKSAAEVQSLRPDFAKIDQLCRQLQSIGCFVFYLSTDDRSCEACGRMFAPSIGVDEDAVNGNSSGCLAAYLMRLPDGESWGSRLRIRVLQGHQSGQAACVNVEGYRRGDRIETYVGGCARVVGC